MTEDGKNKMDRTDVAGECCKSNIFSMMMNFDLWP